MSLGVGPEEMKDPSDRLAAPEIDLRPSKFSIYIYQYHDLRIPICSRIVLKT